MMMMDVLDVAFTFQKKYGAFQLATFKVWSTKRSVQPLQKKKTDCIPCKHPTLPHDPIRWGAGNTTRCTLLETKPASFAPKNRPKLTPQ